MSRIAVIIVTHNSEAVIGRCVAALDKQAGPPVSVIVVDSGSRNQDYLRVFGDRPGFEVLAAGDIGFSRANNLGYQHLTADVEYVVFLNPDVFVEPDTLLQAVRVMD
ncbi:MAG: glycosyltransferase, partial [Proteobacteria bacterium]|nr:glycosyltransferase [Pseudomonadota bacterium]